MLKQIFKPIIISLAILFCYAFFIGQVSATEVDWIDNSTFEEYTSSYYSKFVGQSFNATSSMYIFGIWFQPQSTGATNLTFNICRGIPENTDNDEDCSGIGQELIFATTTAKTFSSTALQVHYFSPDINFCEFYGGYYSSYVFITVKSSNINLKYATNNNYVGYSAINMDDENFTAGDDLVFRYRILDNEPSCLDYQNIETEIIKPTNFTGNVYIGGDDISFIYKEICFIDEQCYFWFSYSPNFIGDDIYFVPDVAGQQNPIYSWASTTIVEIPGYQNAVVLPIESSPVSYDGCLYRVGNNGNTDGLYCGTTVEWVASSTYFNYFFDNFDPYDISSACEGMTAPTSTSSWFDSFSIDFWEYTIGCSLRKTSYWLFTPHDEVYLAMGENINKLTNSFPVSIVNQIYNEYNTSITSSLTPEFNLLYWEPGGATSSMGNLLDTDNFQNSVGYDLFSQIYGGIENVLWALMIVYFIFRFIHMGRGSQN